MGVGRSTSVVVLALGLPLLLAVLLLGALGFRFTYTGSVPVGIYRLVADPPARGTVVLFCLPESVAALALHRGYVGTTGRIGECENGVQLYGKPVLALPGDTVAITPEGLALNGTPVRDSRPLRHDRAGRMLPHPAWGEYVIAPDHVFVFSPFHPEAFDSRYYGSVPDSLVVSVVKPVWLW